MNLNKIIFDTKDYQIIKEIDGNGVFGTVFVVKNKNENTQYAAKILSWEDKFDGVEQTKLLQESLKFSELDHPSITKFKGINFKSLSDHLKFNPTIITEYFPGGSLNITSNFSKSTKSILILGICDGMRRLHEMEILHLDLKPENILIDSDNYPKITNYGLSTIFYEQIFL